MIIANPIYNSMMRWRFIHNEGDFLPSFRGNFDTSNALIWGHGIEPILDSV